MQNSDSVWHNVDAKKAIFEALADRIWGMPELCYLEHRSAAEHAAELRGQGFRTTTGIADIPTAMMGEAGEGGPVIAILGEYDALPGLSQEAGVAERREVEAGGNGHGCGHNLLGSAALLAATAVKDFLAENNLPGRVRYYGCPAEEGGAAKAFMARAGAFADVDVAITWHPAAFTAVMKAQSLANTRIDFTFTGRASHAAAAPHLGRSALDAVELMNVGVNYMREHMPSDSRIHYAMLDGGGVAPNVVQARAVVRYLIRAPELVDLRRLIERVRKVADGATLMTETRVTSAVVSAVSNLLPNGVLERTLQSNLDRLGAPDFDDADQAFARDIQATLRDEDIAADYKFIGLPVRDGQVLCDAVVPLENEGGNVMGSTDVGDVSWVVPTVQAWGAVHAIATPAHSWQQVAQGKADAAHKGMVHIAKAMAGASVDLLRSPELVEKAKAEHAARVGRTPYVCPLPPDAEPALRMSEKV